MSVPIFQKGESFTLKEIIKIVQSSKEELMPYFKGRFEYKGVTYSHEGRGFKPIIKGIKR